MIGLRQSSPRPADFGSLLRPGSANVAALFKQIPGAVSIRFMQVCAINCGGSL